MEIRKSILTLGLLVSLMLIGPINSLASEDLSGGVEKVLNGHTFMPSKYIVDPFVGTSYSSFLGAASAVSLSRDVFDLNGDLLTTLEGSVVYATLGMEFQQKIGQKWAVGFGGSALVRSGTSALSFINDGASVNQNMAAWVKRVIQRSEKSQFTGGLTWKYSTATLFTPKAFAEHIIDGGSLLDAPIMSDNKIWSLQADFLWAHAFNPTFGMRASGNFGVQEALDASGVVVGRNRVGLIGEVDFKDKHDWPIGLSLGFFTGFPSDLFEAGLQGTVLGIWYTAKQDFLVGLETGVLQVPRDDGQEAIDGAFGSFNIKYFF